MPPPHNAIKYPILNTPIFVTTLSSNPIITVVIIVIIHHYYYYLYYNVQPCFQEFGTRTLGDFTPIIPLGVAVATFGCALCLQFQTTRSVVFDFDFDENTLT